MYRSFNQLCDQYKLIYKDKFQWRLTPRIAGEINGLPGSRGLLVATNGIQCLIELGDGTLYDGHIQHFYADSDMDKERLEDVKELNPEYRRKPRKPTINVEDYQALLDAVKI